MTRQRFEEIRSEKARLASIDESAMSVEQLLDLDTPMPLCDAYRQSLSESEQDQYVAILDAENGYITGCRKDQEDAFWSRQEVR